METSFFLTVMYEAGALAEPEWSKSIWLEIKANDVPVMKEKILAFGVREIDSRDKAHFYFQAPGGQVFRLVGLNEDLSRFEK